MTKPCALYRHFDEYSVLLYVGITDAPSNRSSTHARVSDWTRYARHGSIEWYPSRAAALAAEEVAILAERPVFNRVHAPGQALRVREYLDRRKRREALEHLPVVAGTPRERGTSPSSTPTREGATPTSGLDAIPYPNSGGLISLREAVVGGLVACGYEALRKAAQRPGFPEAAALGPRSTRLYEPEALTTWSEGRRAS